MMNFFDLDAWKEARKLTSLVYVKTKKFPKQENFGLTSQLQRASVSVMANIAEGFGRSSIKEKIHFYYQSHGSLTEVQSHIFVATDLQYISHAESEELFVVAHKVQNILQGLIRSTRKRLIS
jgi:four helix bundle protein